MGDSLKEIAIIGGGPAGLRAAEVASGAGRRVTVFDAKASVGRKFLVAGRGGLNLTKAEPFDEFVGKYPEVPRERWRDILSDFDSSALREWAAGLGIETFIASTGRVYPVEMKAAPLLRRWIQRLRESGVRFEMHHQLRDLRRGARWELEFEAPGGTATAAADAVVLALGGASWPQTGSTGEWTGMLGALEVRISPLRPANCGWEISWPAEVLVAAEGQPIKNVKVTAGGESARGELLITSYGLEGGAIYQLGHALRRMNEPVLVIDFKPDNTIESLVRRMGPSTRNLVAEAGRRWRLGDAILRVIEHLRPAGVSIASSEQLASLVKAFPLRLTGPRPIAEAISTAGGVAWSELDDNLMLRALPGVFCAGEMIDWEAPTGGYLMQGCFATGTRAGQGAGSWV